MAFKAIPTVPECCFCIENMKLGSYIAAVYCMLINIYFYGIIFATLGCKHVSSFVSSIGIITSITLFLVSIALIVGLYYESARLIYIFVVVSLICFGLDTIAAFVHMKSVIDNLQKCYYKGYIIACVGLMMPLFLFYCIIVVYTFHHEMTNAFFDKSLEDDDDVKSKKSKVAKII